MSTRFVFRHSHARAQKLFLGPACRRGFVSVDVQPDAPVQITIANTSCKNNQLVTANYVAENISSSPITEFQINAIQTYDDFVDAGTSVTAMGTLQPDQIRSGLIGGGSVTSVCGRPVGPLRQFQLTVSWVKFADGKTWSRKSPHNESLDASGGCVFRNIKDAAMVE